MTDTVFVTGSSRGIGRAIALRLANDGYDVVVHCRDRRAEAEQVAEGVRHMGRRARVLQFDVGNRMACASALAEDIETHGTYYGVVCNAGHARDDAFPAMTGDTWDSVVHGNLDGFYNVLHPLVMAMVRRRAPGSHRHPVLGFRRDGQPRPDQLQRRQGRDHRRHQGAGPGAGEAPDHRQLRGPRIHRYRHAAGPSPLEEVVKSIPMQRAGTVEEVAALVSFLVSPEASYITRQVIDVNGGLY